MRVNFRARYAADMLCYIIVTQCGKTRNSLSLKKKIRQINYLVIPVINTLVSRNFCQNRVRVNFRNFHTVCAACCVIIFWEKFRESNGFTKEEITIELI